MVQGFHGGFLGRNAPRLWSTGTSNGDRETEDHKHERGTAKHVLEELHNHASLPVFEDSQSERYRSSSPSISLSRGHEAAGDVHDFCPSDDVIPDQGDRGNGGGERRRRISVHGSHSRKVGRREGDDGVQVSDVSE